MDINKRKLLAMGGMGFLVGGGTGQRGPEINPLMPGFTIHIGKRWENGKWTWVVAVPDHDSIAKSKFNAIETYIVPIKWMALEEFLAEIES